MISHKPKEPEKKCACEGAAAADGTSRRDFLFKLGIGLNVVAGAMVSLPIIGYVMSSFVKIPKLTATSLGPIDKFPEGTTRLATYENPYRRPWDGETALIPCWVRRIKGEEFQVFAINCTHLGCPVRWFPQSELFMCPCHGGAYYADGAKASGPPPRGLFRYQSRIEDGKLVILGGMMPTLGHQRVRAGNDERPPCA